MSCDRCKDKHPIDNTGAVNPTSWTLTTIADAAAAPTFTNLNFSDTACCAGSTCYFCDCECHN